MEKLEILREELTSFCNDIESRIETVRTEKDPERRFQLSRDISAKMLRVTTDLLLRSVQKKDATPEESRAFFRNIEQHKRFVEEVGEAGKNLSAMLEAIMSENLAEAKRKYEEALRAHKKFFQYE